ncbi:MAG: hypothetical protein WKG01_26165 [Kofleriaceae bacterium]
MRRLSFLLLVACGSRDERPVAVVESTAPIATPAATPDDAVVATVDGIPVRASCVTGQLHRGARDRKLALDECIQFELLAAEAARRGLATAPEVTEATKQAAVSLLVAREFEAKHQTPDDMRQLIDAAIARNRDQVDRPELRASSFVRVEAPQKTTTAEQEVKAKALADAIYAALATETGLFPNHLAETGKRLAAGTGLTISDSSFRASTREGVVAAYGEALFSIPEVGRVAKPARTEWGWDVILWSGGFPAQKFTREEIATQMFPEARRALFQRWSLQLVRASGAKIEIDPGALQALDEAGP